MRELSAAPEVDGILLQLPVPSHLDDAAIIDMISPVKDVDGLHPETVGCVTALPLPLGGIARHPDLFGSRGTRLGLLTCLPVLCVLKEEWLLSWTNRKSSQCHLF